MLYMCEAEREEVWHPYFNPNPTESQLEISRKKKELHRDDSLQRLLNLVYLGIDIDGMKALIEGEVRIFRTGRGCWHDLPCGCLEVYTIMEKTTSNREKYYYLKTCYTHRKNKIPVLKLL